MKPGQYGPSKVAMMFKNYPVGSDQSQSPLKEFIIGWSMVSKQSKVV